MQAFKRKLRQTSMIDQSQKVINQPGLEKNNSFQHSQRFIQHIQSNMPIKKSNGVKPSQAQQINIAQNLSRKRKIKSSSIIQKRVKVIQSTQQIEYIEKSYQKQQQNTSQKLYDKVSQEEQECEMTQQSNLQQYEETSELGNRSKNQRLSKNFRRRKIRTRVSQQSIMTLQLLFSYISQNKEYNGITLTLKDVAKIVNLGYSTILHKYRSYRLKGQVQKGLLLQCKDIKRKYQKSLIIQNYIIEALKQKKFKTAKELAQYINQKHKVKVNRSIISRHLNQMQRDKMQKNQIQQMSIQSSQNKTEQDQSGGNQQLKRYVRSFLGLKQKDVPIYYITVVNIYIQNQKASLLIQDYRTPLEIIHLIITSTQNKLVQCQTIVRNISKDQQQISALNELNQQHIQKVTYQTLYTQLKNKITTQNGNRVYCVFPFTQSKDEFNFRKSMISQYIQQPILSLPTSLQKKKYNFICEWVMKQIVPKSKHFFDQSKNKNIRNRIKNNQIQLSKNQNLKSGQKIKTNLKQAKSFEDQIDQLISLQNNMRNRLDKEQIQLQLIQQNNEPEEQFKINPLIQDIKNQIMAILYKQSSKISKYSSVTINNLINAK